MYRFGHNLSDFRELRKHWRLIYPPSFYLVIIPTKVIFHLKHYNSYYDELEKAEFLLEK